jgi:prepilin-type N-terminal cleavage/methylation domain-containing protein
MNRQYSRRAFTLIELLIVVAIIAILAAIAAPNFLEAQVRSKVSRVKADMRSLALAIESYHTDRNHYPWNEQAGYPARYNATIYRLIFLTTPTAYITSVDIADPFLLGGSNSYEDGLSRYHLNYRNHEFWVSSTHTWFRVPVWVLNSIGPDKIANQGLQTEMQARGLMSPGTVTLYDPTNGTVSPGDIPRTGGETRFKGWF